MEVFVLAAILMTAGEPDAVLPLIAYETKEKCEEKLTVLETDMVFKNPALSFDCYPIDKFNKQQKEEEKRQ